jgi:hypothetical protein
MALELPDKQFFEVACGYAELGMYRDANEQLEKIDPFLRAAPEILDLRIEIYRGLEKWELMQVIAQKLAEFEPDNLQWIISLAYATRRSRLRATPEKITKCQARNRAHRSENPRPLL